MLILFIHLSDIFRMAIFQKQKQMYLDLANPLSPKIPQNSINLELANLYSLNSSLEYTEAKRQFKAKLTAAFFSTGFWKVIQVNKHTSLVKSVANPGKLEFARQKFGKNKGFRFTKQYQFRCRAIYIYSVLSLAQK